VLKNNSNVPFLHADTRATQSDTDRKIPHLEVILERKQHR
jgi:hypothetical protein